MYIFGLGPALFLGILPDAYWKHFCKLVQGVRIIHQWRIEVEQLIAAHSLLLEFVEEFEILYYARLPARLHFVRQSIHAMAHLARETVRIGPGVYIQQWTLERTIGSLGQEMKQPSNPFSNIANRGLRRSQVNALKAIIPDFDDTDVHVPGGAIKSQDDDYVLLGTKDTSACLLDGASADAFREFMLSEVEALAEDWTPKVIRWARLRLPNQQISRAQWSQRHQEGEGSREARCSHNVKVTCILSKIRTR
jgi:hypothetical protein